MSNAACSLDDPAFQRLSKADKANKLVEIIAGPQPLGAKVKSALPLVAELSGFPERRIRAFWNKEARRIDSDEIDALAATARRERPEHPELAQLRAQNERLRQLLRASDPHLAGPPAAPRGGMVRQLGRTDGPEDSSLA